MYGQHWLLLDMLDNRTGTEQERLVYKNKSTRRKGLFKQFEARLAFIIWVAHCGTIPDYSR